MNKKYWIKGINECLEDRVRDEQDVRDDLVYDTIQMMLEIPGVEEAVFAEIPDGWNMYRRFIDEDAPPTKRDFVEAWIYWNIHKETGA